MHTVIVRFSPNDKTSIAIRTEYFNDKNEVINTTNTSNGFQIFGASLNIDRKLRDNKWWRTGLRSLSAKDAIFEKDNQLVKSNLAVTTSLGISF